MNNEMYDSDDDGILTSRLRRITLILGILILLISVFLSYDGFDGAVSGKNSNYEAVSIIIGIVLALTVSSLQFIFSSGYGKLNTTLKVVGFASYIYSIYTNKMGASNLLQMDDIMSWVVAAFCDIVAEPMIAWGLGESMVGDILGNVGKMIFGDGRGNNKTSSRNIIQNRNSQGGGAQKNPVGKTNRISQPSSRFGKPQGKSGDAGMADLKKRLEEVRNKQMRGSSFLPHRPVSEEEEEF